MLTQFGKLLLSPYPHRKLALRIIKKLNVGSYGWRVKLGAVDRPHYGYCVYHGALLAKRLKYDTISVIEFGVAGGNGLLNLEHHAEQVSSQLGIAIQVYGFDSGAGLPAPADYRDLNRPGFSGELRV
jgi:hypothetical protein